MNQVFGLGDRVYYRSQSYTFTDAVGTSWMQESRIVTELGVGTVVDIRADDAFGTVYTVTWDDGPYGEVSPFTGQTYTVNEYPAEYLILAEIEEEH